MKVIYHFLYGFRRLLTVTFKTVNIPLQASTFISVTKQIMLKHWLKLFWWKQKNRTHLNLSIIGIFLNTEKQLRLQT